MIRIVTGLPGSGKSTWAKNHMKPGDIVYDLDRIAGALTMSEEERENSLARQVAMNTRSEMIDTVLWTMDVAEKDGLSADLYIISTNPKKWLVNKAAQYEREVAVVYMTGKYTERGLPSGVEEGIDEAILDFIECCEEKGIAVTRIDG